MPFHKAGFDVVLARDITPYKLRKARILNGSHTMSVLAAFLAFYRGKRMQGGVLIGGRDSDIEIVSMMPPMGYTDECLGIGQDYEIIDSPDVLEFFLVKWQRVQGQSCCALPAKMEIDVDILTTLVEAVCAQKVFWDMDLNELPGFVEKVAGYLRSIVDIGVRRAIGGLIA